MPSLAIDAHATDFGSRSWKRRSPAPTSSIVENLASLPLNLDARDVLYDVLRDARRSFITTTSPWQRPHLAHLEGPRTGPLWRHVTINELSRLELLERGIDGRDHDELASTAIRPGTT